jgi:hypothetical protein
MATKKMVIQLQLTVEDLKIDASNSIDAIKQQIESSPAAHMASILWQYGNFTDSEVTDIHIIESHEF